MNDPRAWIAPALAAGGIACLAIAGAMMLAKPARAAQRPAVLWTVWNETTDTAWTTPRGHQSVSLSATACALATVEAARHLPSGTKISCRRTKQ